MSLLPKVKRLFSVTFLLILALSLLVTVKEASAHEGHDHGEENVEATQSGPGMIVRVKRVEDYEVTIKHSPIEPDKELAARFVLTRFENNEPVDKAKIVLIVEGGDGFLSEVAVTPTSTPGLYEFKLPPMPQGDYKLKVRLDVSGSTLSADFGQIQVKPLDVEPSANESLWARTALIALGVIVILGIISLLLIGAVQYGRRGRASRVKEETLTA